ncbi:hypothetical protein CDAR_18681 [Caerostris darwini]|uniref:Uncharacterized protein n=1 Tax=Caerostris darwini TaxID=1538125 RepID=A0AAV4RLZ3_9ARAC|nr:hypothetical protein CDAR_18681 [Caerostris darwini]
MRQMDARGNREFIRNCFLAFQSGSQTRKERSSKQREPIQIKRCGTSATPYLSPLPLLDRFDLCLSGQKGLRARNCGLDNDSSKVFFFGGRIIDLV